MPTRGGGETMNCDVRTGWERRMWCVPGTRGLVKVSDIGKHVPQDSIRVTSSRLNCEASSNGSLILALDTWRGHSSEHMPVRILTLTHQIHSWHPERGWFLFEWVWAPFRRGCFSTVSPTACPWVLSTSAQGLLVTTSQQMAFRAMVLSALPGSLSALIFYVNEWIVIVVWPFVTSLHLWAVSTGQQASQKAARLSDTDISNINICHRISSDITSTAWVWPLPLLDS